MKQWNRNLPILVGSMLVVVVAAFAFSSEASAQALPWGGIVSGMPSCVSGDLLLSEDVVCVTRGTDNALYSIQINPRTGATSGLKNIGYTRSLAGSPGCTASAAPFIACAVRGEFNELYGIIFNPVTRENTGLQRLDQSGDFRPLGGDPSCVSSGSVIDHPKLGPPTVSCGVRGTDNRLHFATFRGNAQSIAASGITRAEGVVIVGDPSCALEAGNSIVCVARSADSSLAVIEGGSAGSPAGTYRVHLLAGPTPHALGNPSCASTRVRQQFIAAGGNVYLSSSLITCGVRGADSALYVIRFGANENGIFASTPIEKAFGADQVAYRSLGGILTNDPSCASTRSQVVTCGVRGTDGHLFFIDVNTETGSSSPYEWRPTDITGDTRCLTFAESFVACAALDVNNGLVTVASVRPLF